LSIRTEEPANVPTYQYACTDPACDHRFEQFQSFTDAALSVCPVCSGRLRKVYGSVGVVFKGSGFYRNDSRAETNGAKQKQASDASSDSSTSSSSSDSATSSDSGSAGKNRSSAKPSSGSSSTNTSDSSSSSTKAPAKSGSSSAGSAGSRSS